MKQLIIIGLAICFSLFVYAEDKAVVEKAPEKKALTGKFISCEDVIVCKVILAKLDKPITVTWKENSLKDVFNSLSTLLDVKFDIDKSIKLEDEEEVYELDIKGMKGMDALKGVLKDFKLKCKVTENILIISPEAK